jgi:hypothetical protein
MWIYNDVKTAFNLSHDGISGPWKLRNLWGCICTYVAEMDVIEFKTTFLFLKKSVYLYMSVSWSYRLSEATFIWKVPDIYVSLPKRKYEVLPMKPEYYSELTGFVRLVVELVEQK